MVDRNDPSRVDLLVMFAREEKARERESDPCREEGLKVARVTMAETDEAPA